MKDAIMRMCYALLLSAHILNVGLKALLSLVLCTSLGVTTIVPFTRTWWSISEWTIYFNKWALGNWCSCKDHRVFATGFQLHWNWLGARLNSYLHQLLLVHCPLTRLQAWYRIWKWWCKRAVVGAREVERVRLFLKGEPLVWLDFAGTQRVLAWRQFS